MVSTNFGKASALFSALLLALSHGVEAVLQLIHLRANICLRPLGSSQPETSWYERLEGQAHTTGRTSTISRIGNQVLQGECQDDFSTGSGPATKRRER
jgi:hypothetical protein